jgi:hypothetical protein
VAGSATPALAVLTKAGVPHEIFRFEVISDLSESGDIAPDQAVAVVAEGGCRRVGGGQSQHGRTRGPRTSRPSRATVTPLRKTAQYFAATLRSRAGQLEPLDAKAAGPKPHLERERDTRVAHKVIDWNFGAGPQFPTGKAVA